MKWKNACLLSAGRWIQQEKNKKKNIDTFDEPETETVQADDVFEDWNNDQYQQAREQAKLKRQQEKQAQAEKMVNQSLKTVYLKIASIIHPDREPDEAKKRKRPSFYNVPMKHTNRKIYSFYWNFSLKLSKVKTVQTKV